MATQTKKDKSKKKWFTVIAPKEFSKIEIGEIYAYNIEDTLNKILKLNLMTLTKDPKKQNIRVSVKITETKGNQASTTFCSYELQPAYIKKLKKKAKSKIDDSFIVTSKDGIKIRIKPLLFTRAKTNNSLLTAIRNNTRETLKNKFAEMSCSAIVESLLNFSLQKDLKIINNKIYPIQNAVIKAFHTQ